MPVSTFLEQYAAEWRAATQHAFLAGVREGSLPVEKLGRWLVQDYHYVGDLLTFQARLLARAPRADQAVLVGGLVALESELGWFEQHAEHFGLALDAERHPTTERYRSLLHQLDAAPYQVAITALWTIERAYQEAWTYAKPGAPQYVEFVEHWTDPGFIGYVSGLENAANAALDALNTNDADDAAKIDWARKAFLDVARLETAFWEIATA